MAGPRQAERETSGGVGAFGGVGVFGGVGAFGGGAGEMCFLSIFRFAS